MYSDHYAFILQMPPNVFMNRSRCVKSCETMSRSMTTILRSLKKLMMARSPHRCTTKETRLVDYWPDKSTRRILKRFDPSRNRCPRRLYSHSYSHKLVPRRLNLHMVSDMNLLVLVLPPCSC